MNDLTSDLYRRFVDIAEIQPKKRLFEIRRLHEKMYKVYLEILEQIFEDQAIKIRPNKRTILQVVGHIMEWERFFILAFGEILTGIDWPRVMEFKGYLDLDGEEFSFSSINDFNAVQATKHANWSWEQMKQHAAETANVLYDLLVKNDILTAERLEKTRNFKWKLPRGQEIEIPVGWYIWIIIIEHFAVEHLKELKLS
ncbi:MAG: hypothetical protein ACFFCQ_08310 [Promethearchaeota archaeon]